MSPVTLETWPQAYAQGTVQTLNFSLEFLLNSDLGMHCMCYAFYFSQNTFTPIPFYGGW